MRRQLTKQEIWEANNRAESAAKREMPVGARLLFKREPLPREETTIMSDKTPIEKKLGQGIFRSVIAPKTQDTDPSSELETNYDRDIDDDVDVIEEDDDSGVMDPKSPRTPTPRWRGWAGS